MSAPLRPAALTFTSSSPLPGTGSGSSCHSSRPSLIVTARINWCRSTDAKEGRLMDRPSLALRWERRSVRRRVALLLAEELEAGTEAEQAGSQHRQGGRLVARERQGGA